MVFLLYISTPPLHTEVATCHHNSICYLNNLREVGYTVKALNFGNHLEGIGRAAGDVGFQVGDDICCLDKRHCQEIHLVCWGACVGVNVLGSELREECVCSMYVWRSDQHLFTYSHHKS